MANGTVETILGLPVGGFLRTSAGFFQRLPDGRIAFLPSIFRMPWHAKTPRIVDRPEIARLLRMESIEMTIAILMLLLAVHYYFLDILDFYLAALNLPMAIIAHTVSTVLSVILILYINNAPFSWLRARMASAMPIAEGAFAGNEFDDWHGPQKLWRLSLVTNENAASLRKGVVLLYLLLLLAVEFHGGIGLYRLAVKWGWFEGSDPARSRMWLQRFKWALTVFLVTLGLLTLAAYIKIGIEHADRVGERFEPVAAISMPVLCWPLT